MAKDSRDTQTVDFLGRPPGRPRIYKDDAEKQRAYRARKKQEKQALGSTI